MKIYSTEKREARFNEPAIHWLIMGGVKVGRAVQKAGALQAMDVIGNDDLYESPMRHVFLGELLNLLDAHELAIREVEAQADERPRGTA